jgi:exopolyphosphatase/guanosine-5'-triphosphate,3'-diphosphate pyrophosphatase
VLYDMLDREKADTDVRSATVSRLCAKFDADIAQSTRVSRAACALLRRLRASQDADELARHERKLAWAAQLHEIGSAVSHSDYHKHGAYILDNTDAPGFAVPELHRLGLLVLGHRGKLRKLDADFDDELFVHQLICLRLAVILCHARRDPEIAGLQLSAAARRIAMKVPAAWVRRYPQSAYLLRQEVEAWQKMPWSFAVE